MEHFSNAASVHDINVEDQPIGLLGYGLNEALNLLAVFQSQLLRLLVPLLIASVHVETLLTKLRQGQRHGFEMPLMSMHLCFLYRLVLVSSTTTAMAREREPRKIKARARGGSEGK
jgi:hypothetical protein